ncbi:MAG: carboxypeptidase regulatory-like domain-containing protein, partial [Saprospiraceae bacterium]|nr:carboxypeptidase regulatory-like domain-containing protein [Saprospiraceae bacterium]
EDLNKNGLQDSGEPAISGVTVKLYADNNTDGVPDGPALQTTTTNGSGLYSFTGLTPGNYIVGFTTPSGYVPTTRLNTVGDDPQDSDADETTGLTGTINLVSGENDPTNDAGYYKPASIGDYVWFDLDKDGIQDSGEPGISGVTVTLTGTTGSGQSVNLTTTTNASGFYLFSNLQPGTYVVTFTSPGSNYNLSPNDQGGDDTKDSDAAPVTLAAPAEVLVSGENNMTIDAGFYSDLLLNKLVVNVSCFNGNNGSIDLTVTGGTAPYTYLWSTGATTQDVFNLTVGTYTVTVTDANGFTASTSATVTQPPAISLSTVVTNVLCNGASTGSINLTVSGGTPTYAFNWSNGFTGEDPGSLPAGTYTVTVTDANGCTKTTSATITQPPAISLTVSITNVLCNSASTGALNLTVSGGTPAYTYNWSNGHTGEDPTGLAAGTYTVTVTDANGCTKTTSATITQPPALSLGTAVTNVLCNGASTGSINLTVTGGTPTFTYLWSNGATTEDVNDLAAGIYTVTVTDANGCTKTTSATVTQPPVIALSTVVNNVLCNGANTGIINLTATGGTGAKTFLWSNGQTTEDITGLPAGVYTVTVTDVNGCTKTTSATVTQPLAMTLSTVVTNVLCNGASTGAIDLSVVGGTPGYTYSWSNSMTTQDISNLAAGTYT